MSLNESIVEDAAIEWLGKQSRVVSNLILTIFEEVRATSAEFENVGIERRRNP